MNKFFRTAAYAALVLAAASCGSFGKKTSEAAQEEAEQTVAAVLPKVTVAQAERRKVQQSATYTSSVQANVVNNIAPQSSMRIKKIKVEIGDFVYAGQILAEMDIANLEQVRLQMMNDSTELVRIKGLYEVGAVSKSDLDAMVLSYNVRKTSYENLKENTILRTPISGVVTARNYDKGDMYSMSQPLYTVQQITPVKLLVGVSESQYTKVKKGDVVTLSVEALPGQTFKGTIERIYPTMDATTHTFTVEVRVPNKDRKLRPGMYAKVNVNFGSNNSVVIPDQAVVRQQGTGDKFVYVLNEDNTVSYVKVVLGTRMDNEYEVLEGIEDGATVVISGQLRLKDGIEVEVVAE